MPRSPFNINNDTTAKPRAGQSFWDLVGRPSSEVATGERVRVF
jgi:hypothetical protein